MPSLARREKHMLNLNIITDIRIEGELLLTVLIATRYLAKDQ